MTSSQHCRDVAPLVSGPLSRVRGHVQMIAALASRRGLAAFTSRFSHCRFVFAFATVSILGSKVVHIYTHVTALSTVLLLRWGYSFFAQDLVILLIIRLLLDSWILSIVYPLQHLIVFASSILLTYAIALGVISISFFFVSGSEIHWRNIGLVGDSSSWSMFLSGIFSLMLVACFAVLAASLLQDVLFGLFGFGSDLVKWPATAILRSVPGTHYLLIDSNAYGRLPQDDAEFDAKSCSSDDEEACHAVLLGCRERKGFSQWIKVALYVLVAAALTAQLVFFVVRPRDSSLIFMSWTSILLPFVDFSDSSPNLINLEPLYESGVGRSWDSVTAVQNVSSPTGISSPITQSMGFWQKYVTAKHYDARHDPLKISNLNYTLLPGVKDHIAAVPIRHVVILFLESTRKDVFPLKKDGLIWRQLLKSFDGALPKEAEEKLATLTQNANYITGDYQDGFGDSTRRERRRGGINFNNAYTPATYTLKSLIGTLCGTAPLIADFNLEVSHTLPAPCLPHVFDAMNHIETAGAHEGQRGAGAEFLADRWHSSFMQSATMSFDDQKRLLKHLGYAETSLISKEYLKGQKGNHPKHGISSLGDVNYFGIPETPLEDYIRDAFTAAKKKNERVFLSHLTSTSHHPFGLPENETYVPVAEGMKDLSRYMNSIGFDDKWLGKVLGVLEEQDVANETLVVLVGDHGLSMPENGLSSAYYNHNVGNLHVPLVLSHPKLPVIDVNDAVTSVQILPTILDLLVQTGSLAPEHARLARNLQEYNYEGQSMIRELQQSSVSGQGDWQFTIINPGRAMISVRDARQPKFRLVVPVIDSSEWSFTDLGLDPTEAQPVQEFEFASFVHKVERTHGPSAARWAHDAAFISRWWVEENSKRWRYGPHRDF